MAWLQMSSETNFSTSAQEISETLRPPGHVEGLESVFRSENESITLAHAMSGTEPRTPFLSFIYDPISQAWESVFRRQEQSARRRALPCNNPNSKKRGQTNSSKDSGHPFTDATTLLRLRALFPRSPPWPAGGTQRLRTGLSSAAGRGPRTRAGPPWPHSGRAPAAAPP